MMKMMSQNWRSIMKESLLDRLDVAIASKQNVVSYNPEGASELRKLISNFLDSHMYMANEVDRLTEECKELEKEIARLNYVVEILEKGEYIQDTSIFGEDEVDEREQ